MESKQWSMRPYRKFDEDNIRKLFSLVFNKDLNTERWNWCYRKNPTDKILILLAENEKREIVGQYALLPLRMKIGDNVCLSTLSLDTMVHPDYRGQGMFTKLARRMYEILAERGITITYGFPNKNSHYGFVKKLNWVDLCDTIPIFIKLLNTRKVLKQFISKGIFSPILTPLAGLILHGFYKIKKCKLRENYHIQQISRFDDRVNELWDKASTSYRISVVRDKKYLNWRYIDNPSEQYSIFIAEKGHEFVGYIVLKRDVQFGLKVGFIVDVLTLQNKPFSADGLIAMAVEYFRKEGMDIVSCLMLEYTLYADALKKIGFLLMPKKLFPQDLHLGILKHNDSYSKHFIVNPKNWYITWGDHDTI